jgi:hypothetical protein
LSTEKSLHVTLTIAGADDQELPEVRNTGLRDGGERTAENDIWI